MGTVMNIKSSEVGNWNNLIFEGLLNVCPGENVINWKCQNFCKASC